MASVGVVEGVCYIFRMKMVPTIFKVGRTRKKLHDRMSGYTGLNRIERVVWAARVANSFAAEGDLKDLFRTSHFFRKRDDLGEEWFEAGDIDAGVATARMYGHLVERANGCIEDTECSEAVHSIPESSRPQPSCPQPIRPPPSRPEHGRCVPCSVCHNSYVLPSDNRMRKHRDSSGAECPGSGQLFCVEAAPHISPEIVRVSTGNLDVDIEGSETNASDN